MKNQLLDELLKEQFSILEKYELINETLSYIVRFNYQDSSRVNSLVHMIEYSVYEKYIHPYTYNYIELVYNELCQVEKDILIYLD